MNIYDCTIRVLLLALVIVYSITGLQVSYDTMNIPIGDFIALLVVFLFALKIGTTTAEGGELAVRLTYLRGSYWYVIFLVFAFIGVFFSSTVAVSFKFFCRKPLFYFLIYFIALGSCFVLYYRKSGNELIALISYSTLLISIVSLFTSLIRIASGEMWGIMELPLVTNNHKTLAATIVCQIPFVLAGIRINSGNRLLIHKISLAIAVAAVLLSMAKAPWLILLLILVFDRYMTIRNPLARRVVTSLVAFAAIAAIVVVAVTLSQNTEVVRGEISRVFLMIHTYRMFVSAPFLGSGPGSFMAELQQYERFFAQHGFPTAVELDAHGLIFKIVTENGLIGLALFLMFYYRITKNLVEESDGYLDLDPHKLVRIRCGLLTLIVTLCLNSFFGTDTYNPRMWLPITLAAVQGVL